MINPTEDHETVKEFSKEELFWNYEDMPDEAVNYIDELERKIRKMKNELIELQSTFSKHQTYYINQILKIIK